MCSMLLKHFLLNLQKCALHVVVFKSLGFHSQIQYQINWYHNMPRAINVLRFLPLAFINLVQPPTLKYKIDLTYDCKLRQGRVDDKNKHVSRPPFVCLGLVWMKPSCERLRVGELLVAYFPHDKCLYHTLYYGVVYYN